METINFSETSVTASRKGVIFQHIAVFVTKRLLHERNGLLLSVEWKVLRQCGSKLDETLDKAWALCKLRSDCCQLLSVIILKT